MYDKSIIIVILCITTIFHQLYRSLLLQSMDYNYNYFFLKISKIKLYFKSYMMQVRTRMLFAE